MAALFRVCVRVYVLRSVTCLMFMRERTPYMKKRCVKVFRI